MTSYDKYIANTRFCNDTTVASTSGNYIYYGAFNRISESFKAEKDPIFQCANTEKTYGGEYDLKVGLITADEVQYAGERGFVDSNYFYMAHKSSWFWTASPYTFSSYAYVFGVSTFEGLMDTTGVSSEDDVRPTVNLKTDTLYTTGNGTKSNPYIINK